MSCFRLWKKTVRGDYVLLPPGVLLYLGFDPSQSIGGMLGQGWICTWKRHSARCSANGRGYKAKRPRLWHFLKEHLIFFGLGDVERILSLSLPLSDKCFYWVHAIKPSLLLPVHNDYWIIESSSLGLRLAFEKEMTTCSVLVFFHFVIHFGYLQRVHGLQNSEKEEGILPPPWSKGWDGSEIYIHRKLSWQHFLPVFTPSLPLSIRSKVS